MTQLMNAPAATGNGNAVARRFEPMAPIGSANGLKALLEAQAAGIRTALPKHVTPERLIKTMLVAANRNPGLLNCTQSSIMETINRAAELGLDLSGTLGEAYPVPFKNKVTINGREAWVDQCQLIIGYRGMEKLAWQSGDVESIDAEVVYSNDTFTFKKGTTVLVEWSPCMTGDRGKQIGAYACVSMKSGGKLARFLPASDIEKIRASSKSKDSPAWKNWPDEMWRKCALKRTLKDAPLSTEKYVAAMEHDNEDVQFEDVLEVSRQDRGRAIGLQERINQQKLLGQSQQAAPVQDEPVIEDQSTTAATPAVPTAQSEPPTSPAPVETSNAEPEKQEDAPAQNDATSDDMTPWQKLTATVSDLCESRGAKLADAIASLKRSLPTKYAKAPETLPEAECKKILEAARDGRGFFAFMAPPAAE